ncbi:DUF5682 family protein [Stagnihabitans tardus]|uniref:4-aminobutyrate aminotransferase n=1 Tax=Stagnihabitans tardus TaxID=2699202 RepID=A0AAE4Y5Y8_9RHOB|nr:hypothetical protein [Stagnihabitans tardus]
MSDFLTRDQALAALFGGPVAFAPIRHHSPACAHALRSLIRAHRPEVICIEAPTPLSPHIPHLTEPDLVFPVALLTLHQGRQSYYPLSAHSPETIALQEAKALGAEVWFIDLPSRLDEAPRGPDETPFSASAFVAETCARLGLRDGAELWDHLFEARMGTQDWQGFFADVLTYCAALRHGTDLTADDTLPREAEMRRHIARLNGRRAVVVTGGFHTPALFQGDPGKPPPADPSESYLIAYGEEALDALSGYGAGLRHPAWYARLWQAAQDGPPDWLALARDLITDFTAAQAAQGHRIAVPQQVETLTLAAGLASLRGRGAVLLPDLSDALRSALVKGETGPAEPWTRAFLRFLNGTAFGRAPASAGQPPLLRDARARAQAARFDLSTSVRRPRKLDFRRKPSHATASQFCHQMAILDAGFAQLTAGPDLVGGVNLGLLFEDWDCAWTPFVEGRLIEAARLGADLPSAALARLLRDAQALGTSGQGQDLGALVTLMLRGWRAGLGPRLGPLVAEVTGLAARSPDLGALARTLRRLTAVAAPTDPLHDPQAPDLGPLLAVVFDRMILLTEDLPQSPDEALPEAIAGLSLLFAATLTDPRFDRPRLQGALHRVAADPRASGLLLGAVAGLLTRSGQMEPAACALLLQGQIGARTLKPQDRAALLDGFLRTAPMLLWQDQAILAACHAALSALSDEDFTTLLPALRLSLSQLNPHETDRLAAEVTRLTGQAAAPRTSLTEADLARGLALDRALAAQLAADGLAHWGEA